MTLNNLSGAIKAGMEIASGTDFSGKLQRGSGFGDLQLLCNETNVTTTLGSADVMLLVKGKLRGVYSLTDAINIINNDPKITAKTKASDVIIRLNQDVTLSSGITLTKPCTIDGRGTLGVSGLFSLNVTSPALSLVNLNTDIIMIANPGTTLSLKNVSTLNGILNRDGTINVSGRLDAEGINAAKLKLTKAKLSVNSGMMLGSSIRLSGASTWTYTISSPPIIHVANSKSLTSGSGTLTLKTSTSGYVPNVGHALVADDTNTLTSYGRLKLGTG
ncbi:hypothetical protein LJC33_08880, partial [Eubacteriales bacterium OttesenSCG-928-N13]|nr:hypothetical protein [Eubacteriales bacterium OttesenSCG-928-N13]